MNRFTVDILDFERDFTRKIATEIARFQDTKMKILLERNGIDVFGLTIENAQQFKESMDLKGYQLFAEIEHYNIEQTEDGFKGSQKSTMILKKDGIEIDRL